MYIRTKQALVLCAVLVIMVGLANSGWLGKTPKHLAVVATPGLYKVTSYSDGDTIVVDMNGKPETIRFIGVDTPETHDPRKPVQCYGEIAATYTKSKIEPFGQVRLQSDPLNTNRDRYDRLLRYVYLPDGTLLDEQIIKEGYGFAYLNFPFELADQFAAAQLAAQESRLGLWSACKPELNEYGSYSSNPA